MPKKIALFAVLLVLIGFVSVLFIQNPQAVQVAFLSGESTTAPLALVMISAFCFGVLLCSIIMAYVGMKHYFQVRALQKKETILERNRDLAAQGRAFLAADNLERAKNVFQIILDRDPKDISARVLLAETLQKKGDTRRALQVIDEGRQVRGNKLELLLLGARFQSLLGNDTATYDNLILAIAEDPENPFILQKLVSVCARLDRLAEAIELQKMLIRTSPHDRARDLQLPLAHLELKRALQEFPQGSETRREALENILRAHRNFAPAMFALALLEREKANVEQASRLLISAFQQNQNIQYLLELGELWLSIDSPEKALSAVRAALLAKKGELSMNIPGSLLFASLCLRLEIIDDAKASLMAINETDCSAEDLAVFRYLQAKVLERQGKTVEAIHSLQRLVPSDSALACGVRTWLEPAAEDFGTWKSKLRDQLKIQNQPSPALSHP